MKMIKEEVFLDLGYKVKRSGSYECDPNIDSTSREE
jgi:hypothetical protein